jgi:membrane-bound lytic murein transglycosylase A
MLMGVSSSVLAASTPQGSGRAHVVGAMIARNGALARRRQQPPPVGGGADLLYTENGRRESLAIRQAPGGLSCCIAWRNIAGALAFTVAGVMEGLAISNGRIGSWSARLCRDVRHCLVIAGAAAVASAASLQPVEAAPKSASRSAAQVHAAPAGKGAKADPRTRARGPQAVSKLQAVPQVPDPQGLPYPPEPLKLPDSQVEPIEWSALDGWAAEDHAAAFATFRASCRPLVRTDTPKGEARPMYFALRDVCRRALAAGPLTADTARQFFEQSFRPARVAKLGDSAGLLTGYFEPIIDGSRFPTPVFKVAIYRRPPDLIPPPGPKGKGFPNRGQSMRLTSSGRKVPYYDRGEILQGALDGKYLEICWIKDPADLITIQLQGSARVRLEDGVIVRLNYDGHNGYPFVPVSRILASRKLIPKEEMSSHRIRDWMRENPEAAEEVRRGNRNFVFFRIVGLSDERDGPGREAFGAQGIPLTPERSLAVDDALHVYGTPFFIQAGLPLAGSKPQTFTRLMVAQDTGSAMVGAARADIYWGAGDQAGQVAGRTKHPGSFAMLVPREIDPVAAGRLMPLPPGRPPAEVIAGTRPPKAPIIARDEESIPLPPARPAGLARAGAPASPPKPPIVARSDEGTSARASKPPAAARGGEVRRAPVERSRRSRARQPTPTTGSIW